MTREPNLFRGKDLLGSWVLVYSCRERRTDRRGGAAGSTPRGRLRNASHPWPGALRARGTSCPSTTGFVWRRRWTWGGRARIAALKACAALSWVSKNRWARLAVRVGVLRLPPSRPLVPTHAPELDVGAVGSRVGSGATTAERLRGPPGRWTALAPARSSHSTAFMWRWPCRPGRDRFVSAPDAAGLSCPPDGARLILVGSG